MPLDAILEGACVGHSPWLAYLQAVRRIADKISKLGFLGDNAKELAIRAGTCLKIKVRKPLGILAKSYEWRNLWLYENRVGPQPIPGKGLMKESLEVVLKSATKTSRWWNWFFGVE